MSNINEELLALLKKNLPQEMVGVFKERIDELEVLSNQVEPLKVELSNTKTLLSNADKIISELKSYADRLDYIEKKEQELKQAEINLLHEREILQLKQSFSEARVNDHQTMFATVFRNSVLRETVNKNIVLSGGSYSNGNGGLNTAPDMKENVTDFKTTEKE